MGCNNSDYNYETKHITMNIIRWRWRFVSGGCTKLKSSERDCQNSTFFDLFFQALVISRHFYLCGWTASCQGKHLFVYFLIYIWRIWKNKMTLNCGNHYRDLQFILLRTKKSLCALVFEFVIFLIRVQVIKAYRDFSTLVKMLKET